MGQQFLLLMANNYCCHLITKNAAITYEIWIVNVLALTVDNLGLMWGEKRHWQLPVKNTEQLWGKIGESIKVIVTPPQIFVWVY